MAVHHGAAGDSGEFAIGKDQPHGYGELAHGRGPVSGFKDFDGDGRGGKGKRGEQRGQDRQGA